MPRSRHAGARRRHIWAGAGRRQVWAGTGRRQVWIFLVLLTLILPCAAAASPAVVIRQGRHGSMGRLVFDFPSAVSFRSKRQGDVLTIEFTPPEPIAPVALGIPGMVTLQGGVGIARLLLAPDATPKIYRFGNRVVVDSQLPANGRPKPASVQVQPKPVMAAANPLPLPVTPAPVPEAAPPPAFPTQAIDFASQPGAAAFRRGSLAMIVFDTPEIPDLTDLQSAPLFAEASLRSLQDAQVITIPLPAEDALALTPVSGGWQVAAVSAAPPGPAPPISMAGPASTVEFPMQSANQSIVISDPLTGGDLLVGTVTQGSDAANYMESGPGYAVLPAWAGVVIVPQADDLGLNASLKGFELVSDAAGGLPLGTMPQAAVAASPASPGQSLALPGGPTAALWRQLVADQLQAAILPPLGRLDAQIKLARDMLALGMGPEAIGVLDTAVLENPAAQDNGQIAELRAIGNVLAHRSQAADFVAPGIVPGPELAFWQAAGGLDQGDTAPAIPALLAGLQYFESYPATLRNPVAAPVAEALIGSGQLPAAQALIDSDPHDPCYDLARAELLQDQGQAAAALAEYQVVARGDDQRASAIAQADIVELQLASGQLNDGQAADALDAQLFNWRATAHERNLRLRIAALRAAAGQWPQAFDMLGATRRLFPGHRHAINHIRAAMFLRMLSGDGFARISPIQAVAVLEQNQDLIPASGDNTQVIRLLAQRLEALDLPGAAAPMLSHLIQTIPPGVAAAGLGATLAQVDLDAGSPVAALADLSQTGAENLPPELAARRNMLAASAQAAAGNAVAAVNTLATPVAPTLIPAAPDPDTLQMQAKIAEQSGQWSQAEQALNSLVSGSVPATGPLGGDQENLLLRLATAASHNGDTPALAALGSQYGARVGADPAGQMFQTLTAPPLTGDQGLNQALHEIAQLQAMPAMLDAVSAPAKTQAPGPQ